MKTIKPLLVFFFLLSINLFSQQKEDYSKLPGYFNYQDFSQLKDAESTTEVYLEEPLLKMITSMAEDKTDGLGDAISGLKLVRVNEFKIPKDEHTNMGAAIESMDKILNSKKWDRIVRISRKGNYTNIYIKKEADGALAGLTIISLEKAFDKRDPYSAGKATFVNIVGKIDLDKLGKLTKKFNLPGLDNMKNKEKDED